MIPRRALPAVAEALSRQAAVALAGPRQVGKTTLALALAEKTPSLCLDLERREDRDKLADPALFLKSYEDRLVVLDEIHRVPELFQTLRGLIDQGRRRGRRTNRFLILGSASMDLLRQSGESLAGRISYVEMGPLDVLETGGAGHDQQTLWVRGGFPESFLADDDRRSTAWRKDFIRTCLEREIPALGPPRSGGNAGASLDDARAQSGRIAQRFAACSRPDDQRTECHPLHRSASGSTLSAALAAVSSQRG